MRTYTIPVYGVLETFTEDQIREAKKWFLRNVSNDLSHYNIAIIDSIITHFIKTEEDKPLRETD
nr:hypothetical protein [Nanoarchaeota archaeon]